VAILTDDMKRVVREQRLGFHATVCADGTPNLSPKGTTAVWDDDHLCFAHIHSAQTVENIRRGSLVEINVVDPFSRKGYRFKGAAVIHDAGSPGFATGVERLRREGYATPPERIKSIVVIHVAHASALVSPAYDDGARSEDEIVNTWQEHFRRLDEQRRGPLRSQPRDRRV